MLFLKYLLTSGGIAMMVIAAGILVYDFYLEIRHRQTQAMPEAAPTAAPHIRWRTSLALALLAWGPLLIAAGIVVVPSGMAGVRVSQTKGTLPGTLYPGAHFVTPLAENVALFDTRDQLFTTGESEDAKAAADGIIVKEVMLRDIQLPPEYAKGLENLLLKEQENDQMGVQTEIQEKQVRLSELEAEAAKAQQVKQAEGQAQVRVLEAKGEADAMQYTLPLKQKQIEQSKLEAEARKETTVKNAEAMAQAKVIDSKAENERRKLLAEAEADRIRVTSAADAERMSKEGAILKQNPLLINKIVAEKLSDKLQIMMVPADGKFFFANDVLRSMNMANRTSQAEEAQDPPEK